MNPNKNLPKRSSSMTDNSKKYFDNLNDQMKQAFALIQESNNEILRLNEKVNLLKQEKQEFEDQEKNRSEISEQLIHEAHTIFQEIKNTIQKAKHDNP